MRYKYILIGLGLVALIMFVMPNLVLKGLTWVIPSLASALKSKPFLGPPIGISIELATTLVLIEVISRGSWTRYGFKTSGNLMILKVVVASLILSISCVLIGNVINIFAPMGNSPYVYMESSPLLAILAGWIFAPITEEVVFRGLIQSYLSEHITDSLTLFKWRITLPALIGAIFFAAVHTVLLFQGASISVTIFTVLSAFVSGITAGYFRDETSSLVGPFIIHILFNVIGNIGGL